MKIAVTDANVFIDLEVAGLLDLWFQLGYETHTTDLIRAELEDGGHSEALSYFATGQVTVHSLDGEAVIDISGLESELSGGASFNDCSVLHIAIRMQGERCLLTGDGALRGHAPSYGIEVHGTLWVFDTLIDHNLLAPKTAVPKLQALIADGTFLPKLECDKRLKKWGLG